MQQNLITTIQQSWWQRRKNNWLSVKLHTPGRVKIGMSILDLKKMKKDNYGGTFAVFDECLKEYLAQKGKNVDIYFIQHAKEDGEQQKQLAKKYGCTFVPYRTIGDMPTLNIVYQNIDLLVGVRLHSIALGIMADKPTIAIGSEHAKQKRLSEFNLPTLKKQFVSLGDEKVIRNLFKSLLHQDYLKSLSKLSVREKKFIELQKTESLDSDFK